LKIAHVIHAFPPDSWAGSENYAAALAREQQRGGDEVVVFHRVSDPQRAEYETSSGEAAGVPVVRLNRTFADATGFRHTYRNDRVAERFGAFLERERPELVHFHHVTCLSTSCVHEARRRRIPVVYTLHDFWLLCPRGQLLRRDLSLCDRHTRADCVRCMAYQVQIRGGHAQARQLLARAERLTGLRVPRGLARRLASRPFAREDAALEEIAAREQEVREMCAEVSHFIAPSRFLAQRYIEFGIPAERISVSDYGFDVEALRAAARSAPDPASPLRVAYIGTWIPSKGVHVLIEAFREIDARDATLEIHGYAVPYDGFDDYEGHLRRLAGGAASIRFRGAYEPRQTKALLEEADVVVVPSIWYENSPLTIHEAFLAGVPVIASRQGGMQELVEHGRSGLTFRPGDAQSLREALERLIRDRGLLAQLRSGIPPVKPIERDAAEIRSIYARLRAA